MSTTTMTRESVRGLLAKQKDEFNRALSNRIDPDYFVRVALTAINKTPKLLLCTQESLLACLMDCAQLGLEPDSVQGLAYLIPFDDKKKGMICTLVVGFQGFIQLAYKNPKVKAIRYGTVRSTDHFEYEEGLNPRLVHRPDDDVEPGDLTHAYAICDLDNGGQTWVVMNRRQVMKAKSASKSAHSDYSPWNTFEESMWAKTAVRQLAKRIPKSRELAEALTRDDREYDLDVEASVVPSKLLEQATVEKMPEMPQQPEKEPVRAAKEKAPVPGKKMPEPDPFETRPPPQAAPAGPDDDVLSD